MRTNVVKPLLRYTSELQYTLSGAIVGGQAMCSGEGRPAAVRRPSSGRWCSSGGTKHL